MDKTMTREQIEGFALHIRTKCVLSEQAGYYLTRLEQQALASLRGQEAQPVGWMLAVEENNSMRVYGPAYRSRELAEQDAALPRLRGQKAEVWACYATPPAPSGMVSIELVARESIRQTITFYHKAGVQIDGNDAFCIQAASDIEAAYRAMLAAAPVAGRDAPTMNLQHCRQHGGYGFISDCIVCHPVAGRKEGE